MNTQQFASNLKKTIQEIKDKGANTISCENLITYLNGIENSKPADISDVELERYKAELQLHIEQSKNYHNENLEMFRSVIASGQSAIRSSFLLNGGASVALLAFIGHLASSVPDKVEDFAVVIVPFVLSVLIVTIASGLTYLCQWLYHSDTDTTIKVANWLNVFTIILGFSSYFVFAWGMCLAYSAFQNFV